MRPGSWPAAAPASATGIPIQKLLDRIRWDRAFGKGHFTIGYYDRKARQIVTVPLERVEIVPGNHFSFTAAEADGSIHEIPFHRVREVHRNGELIWQRPSVSEPR